MSVLEKVTFNFSLSNNYQLIKLLLSPDHWRWLLFELDSESSMSQHCAKQHVGTVTTDLFLLSICISLLGALLQL